MSTRQENLAKNKDRLGKEIRELDRVIQELAVNGTASATLSSGGGSKSYTRMDLDKLRAYRADIAHQFSSVCRALRCGTSPAGIRHVMVVRGGYGR